MTDIKDTARKKLFIKLYSESDARRLIPGSDRAAELVRNLRRDGVEKIYIIAPGQSVSRPYITLFMKGVPGIIIRDMVLDRIERRDVYTVKSIIDDINASIKKGRSCEIILFNESLAGIFLACFYENTGKNPDLSIEEVRRIIPGVVLSGSDISFINEFNNLIRETYNVAPDYRPEAAEPAAETVKEPAAAAGAVRKRESGEIGEIDAIKRIIDRAEPAGVLSKFRIATKLVTLVAIILVVSLALMIFLGTAFFRQSGRSIVNGGNDTAARLIGERLQVEIASFQERARAAAELSSMGRSSEEAASRIREMLFRESGNFIFMGIAVREGDGLKFKKTFYNEDYINMSQVSRDTLRTIHRKNEDYFVQSFKGRVIVRNVSPDAGEPVMGISFPYRKKGDAVRSVIVCYLPLDRLIEASRLRGPAKTSMVSDRGDCLVDAERNRVVSRVNMAEVPIVKKMLFATADNGAMRYRDSDGRYHLGSYRKLDAYGVGVIVSAAEDSVLRGVYDAQRRNFILLAIILTAAVAGAFIFSKTISAPIEELQRLAAEIPVDVLKLSAPGEGDEIFYMTRSFKDVLRSYVDLRERPEYVRHGAPAAAGPAVGPDISAPQSSREGVTQQFRAEGLKVQVTYDGPNVTMVWMGKGSVANPGELLNPYLEGIINSMRGRELICDFSSLESMNAAIVQSIIKFAHLVHENRVLARFIYNKTIDWQDASFEALSAVVQEMDTISLDGRILEKNMFIL